MLHLLQNVGLFIAFWFLLTTSLIATNIAIAEPSDRMVMIAFAIVGSIGSLAVFSLLIDRF